MQHGASEVERFCRRTERSPAAILSISHCSHTLCGRVLQTSNVSLQPSVGAFRIAGLRASSDFACQLQERDPR